MNNKKSSGSGSGSKENADKKSGSNEKDKPDYDKVMETTAKSLRKKSKKVSSKDASATSRRVRRQKFTARIGQVLNKAMRREKEKVKKEDPVRKVEPPKVVTPQSDKPKRQESSKKRVKPKAVSKTQSKVRTPRARETAAESSNAKSEKSSRTPEKSSGNAAKSEKLARLKKTQSEMVNKVEKSVRELLQQLGPKCTGVFEEQWEHVDSYEVFDNDCLEFLAHQEWNQAEEIECLDANRVKLEKSDVRDYDYIHASHIEIKGIPRKFILAQLPMTSPKRMSDFWAMIYQEKLHNIYFLCSPDESNKPEGKQFSEYFPIVLGSHENFEHIWVHNRKVETAPSTSEQNDTHTIEVLPNGCAESVMVSFQMLNYWPEHDVGANRKKVLTAASTVFGVADAYEGDPIGIISKQGSGRAGTFLAIICAIQVLKDGGTLNLKEMCRSIREQRPGSIDNYFQFVFIYSIVLQYAVQNVTNKELVMQLEKIIRSIDFVLAHKPTTKKVRTPSSE